MEGESTDYVWGVLDAVPLTNFPDIRHRCAIHSAENGSIMVIPREQGVVRFYIQLQETPRDPNTKTESEKEAGTEATTKGRVDRSQITPEFILGAAQKIFAPYTIDVRDIRWYTAYQIGQRVSPSWHKHNRVFISGDACHTHSPKAGQGMNTSMMDTYNLGWKLAWVCKGLADQKILATYEDERRQNAYDLINFDHKLSRLFSGKPHLPGQNDDGVSLEEFRKVFEMGKAFASGCIIDYNPSCLEAKSEKYAQKDQFGDLKYINPLASKTTIGMRFDSAQVVSQSEATPHYINDVMPSDGRFRILNFAGDIKKSPELTAKLQELGAYLESDKSFIKKYTPAGAKIDSIIEVLTIHASPRVDVEWEDFPAAFHPKDKFLREDYWKIYTDDQSHHHGHGHAYEKYGVDPKVGALIVVRPDGYVSHVAPLGLEGIEDVAKFFEGFALPAAKPAETVEEVDQYGVAEVPLPVLAL
ncbi:thioredoxin-like protein [Myxozyma melibiosi]|uniref:Thioredoxin-like protein n=1 Tax=Myxozyma melibiosi TaxID=54550 RepID=A0ABR1F9Z6_9ASCO